MRFLENHLQDRAAAAFERERHQAAAALMGLSPGLVLFAHGQLEGWRSRVPLETCRLPPEGGDAELEGFYGRLLTALKHPALRGGQWRLLDGHHLPEQVEDIGALFVLQWYRQGQGAVLGLVNFSGQSMIPQVGADILSLDGRQVDLVCPLSQVKVTAHGRALLGPGVPISLGPWEARIFHIECD